MPGATLQPVQHARFGVQLWMLTCSLAFAVGAPTSAASVSPAVMPFAKEEAKVVCSEDMCKWARCVSLIQAASQKSRTAATPVGPEPEGENRSSAAPVEWRPWLAPLLPNVLIMRPAVRMVELVRSGGATVIAAVSLLLFVVLANCLGALLLLARPGWFPRCTANDDLSTATARPSDARLPAAALAQGMPLRRHQALRVPALLGHTSPSARLAMGPGKSPSKSSAGCALNCLGESMNFCPDLVVPKGSECVLLVPIRSLGPRPLEISDVNGHVLLCAVTYGHNEMDPVSTGSSASLGESGGLLAQRLALKTAGYTQKVLAQCCAMGPPTSQVEGEAAAVERGGGHAEFMILAAGGTHFAKLSLAEPGARYILSTPGGGQLHFWGSFEHHAVNIVDGTGKLLATTELCTSGFDVAGEYYRLRVGPLGDVCLVLCSLLCIDHLEEGCWS
mmetsp:Transcript_75103/g.168525  ORF Transcript_75103/g.168525 Transcript_75103/m.168525 type:complete len:447 (+) Transcript_75103:135-1475(+)